MKVSRMARISLKVPDDILQVFDSLCKYEGWESRQEAIVFLLQTSIARGYISREKSDIVRKMPKSEEKAST